MTGKRVFLISLDGATFDVLRPLADQGYLPNLGPLMTKGLAADLESVVPPVTASAWSSFMTGKNPSKHGIFDFVRFDVHDYRWKLNNSQHIRSKNLWQILSENGKRVAVLNLPYTYPPCEVNGVMVSGWDAPSSNSFTYPAELGREIFQLIPDYGSALDLSLWNYLPTESDGEFNEFVGKLIRSFEQGATLASHFLAREEWDVFMIHFQQTDWIQHKLWGYIERACRNAADRSQRVEKVRECYRTFDRHVGELLTQAGSTDVVSIVLSDHGFGANRGTLYPNYLLRQWGYFHMQSESGSKLKNALKDSRYAGVRKLYRSLRNRKNSVQHRSAIKKYKGWADMANETVPQQKFPVDWERTKVAVLPGSETCFLYVNVKDRGPVGTVEPGAEYESLLAELIDRFRGVRDPETGKPLLRRIARGKDVYPVADPNILLPDLVLVPLDGVGTSAGLTEAFATQSGEEGSHRHNGILLMQGEGVRDSLPDFQPNLIDVAPTILNLLGLAVPEDMDGRVLQEVFTAIQEVRFEAVDNSRAAAAADYTDEEAELIEQRLKGLGYVE